MSKPSWARSLLRNPAFLTFLTGAGFFSDSYDLFITDGVTNILKNLGPVTRVDYAYVANNVPATLTSYFTATCARGVACLPRLYNNATSAWEANPASVFSADMIPRYQLQTTALKNGVSNAALVGSIVGQLAFGFAGDVLGRKWCFVLTTALIIVGCLGSAAAAAGGAVKGNLNAAGVWGDTAARPTFAADVYTQLGLWRFVLGVGVGGEYPLAGAISSEGARASSRGRSVLYTFSMQGCVGRRASARCERGANAASERTF
jgi:MFS family permease